MEKIKKIYIKDDSLYMMYGEKELSVKLNQEYVKKLMDKALLETKEDLVDLKFYKRGAKICLIPVFVALSSFLGAWLADFIAMDLIAILCGGMAGTGLVGYSLFKAVESKIEERANNNEYWLKIREIAINNITESKKKVKKNNMVKTNNNNKTRYFKNNLIEEEEIVKRR